MWWGGYELVPAVQDCGVSITKRGDHFNPDDVHFEVLEFSGNS